MTALDLTLAAASPALDAAVTAALALRDPVIADRAQIDAPVAYGSSEVTTMTTQAAPAAKAANLYPFTTKAQIKARLDGDAAFRIETMCLLHTLQTEHEQATMSTLTQNRMGFMSSHAVWGSRIAVKVKAHLASGGTVANAMAILTAEEWSKVDAIAPRYSRQLAAYYRAREIAENPALAETAKLFSAA